MKDAISDRLGMILADWPTGLPTGVIHADLFPNNVLFIGDGLTGVIDFYFACDDILAYDLGICLNSWCFEPDGSFNLTKSRAMLKGYQSVRPLNDAEIEAIPILAAGSAMRFFLTRLYDWIHTPADALVSPKDPMEYWGILRFHQSVSGTTAYGIGL
jgi:homoserine kinase type II